MGTENNLQSRGMPFGNKPYVEVQSVFEGFTPPGDLDRGRYERKVPPLHGPSNPNDESFSPDYHVKSTFSRQQMPYVATVAAYIDALAQGNMYGHTNDPKPPPFSLLVIAMFCAKSRL